MKPTILAGILAAIFSLFSGNYVATAPSVPTTLPPSAANAAAAFAPALASVPTQTTAANAEPAQHPSQHVITYTVQAGDTLSGIAQTFGIPVSNILLASDLSQGAILHPGDKLIIPDPQTAPATSSGTAPDATSYQTTNSQNVKSADSEPATSAYSETPGSQNFTTSLIPTSNFVTQAQFNSGLAELGTSLLQLVGRNYEAPLVSGPAAPLSVEAFAPSQAIDQLSGTTLNNVTVNGVSGLTASEIPALDYLSLSGGSLTGTLNVPSLSASSTNYGVLTATNASTTLFSNFGTAYFGGTATSTFDSAGDLTLGGSLIAPSNVTLGNATSTNLFSTIASSTNLFAQAAYLGSLQLSSPLAAAYGGTGSTTLFGILKGNGTGGIQTAVAGTDYQSPIMASLKDFGAKCDGVTDDSAAIQAAASSGENVVIPNTGTCSMGSSASTIVFSSNTTFIGQTGAVIGFTNASLQVLSVPSGANNVHITNVTFNENASGHQFGVIAGNDFQWNGGGTINAGTLFVSDADGTIIENAKFTNFTSNAVDIENGATDTTFTDNECEATSTDSSECIRIDAATNWLVQGNWTNGEGVELVGDTYQGDDGSIIGNRAEGVGDNGISFRAGPGNLHRTISGVSA